MVLAPSDAGYQVQALLDRVSELETRVDRLERRDFVSAQKATVTAYTGGSNMVNVQYATTGTVASVPYMYSYTPAVGHGGYVIYIPKVWYGFMPVSVPVTI